MISGGDLILSIIIMLAVFILIMCFCACICCKDPDNNDKYYTFNDKDEEITV